MKSTRHNFVVVPNLVEEIIVGMDLLNLFKISMNLGAKTISFKDIPCDIATSVKRSADQSHQQESDKDGGTIKLHRETVLEARSLAIVEIESQATGPVLINPHQVSPTLITANSVTGLENGRGSMMIGNLDIFSVRLPDKFILGSCETQVGATLPHTGEAIHLCVQNPLAVEQSSQSALKSCANKHQDPQAINEHSVDLFDKHAKSTNPYNLR